LVATDAHGWSRMKGRLAELTCRRVKMGMVECSRAVNIPTIVNCKCMTPIGLRIPMCRLSDPIAFLRRMTNNE